MDRPARFGRPGCRCHCCILRNARCAMPANLLFTFIAAHWCKVELIGLYAIVDNAMLEKRWV